MGIDRYYTRIDRKWVPTNVADENWYHSCEGERSVFDKDFWVDLCHGGGLYLDERYYFPDLPSALEFYLYGWKDRQYFDDGGQPCGIDHSGLCSRRLLIHGRAVYGDTPAREGEALRDLGEVHGKVLRQIDEDESP